MAARGAASRRKEKVTLGVIIALLVLVPSGMFAAGLGHKIGRARGVAAREGA
jgi:hypothetical protein